VRQAVRTFDVAIDARVTRRMSGGMRAYLAGLLDGLPRVAPDVRVQCVGGGDNFGWAEQVALPRAIARAGPALTHYPTVFAPLVRRRPYVATVHDLIHLQFPRFFGPATALHYQAVAAPMLRAAALLLMGDERTAAACEQLLGIPRERCRVVPLGYDPALLAPSAPLVAPRPFILYAGNHRPHKNLPTLYQAWATLPPAIGLDLEVTGEDDPAARAAFSRSSGELRFLGTLEPVELARHYRAALAYVHPALAEGFGIPMLEATALGTPVLASAACVPAVVAPYAATFAPHDVLALQAALASVVADPAPFRRRAFEGSVAVRAYTWDRFAAATAAVYREVVDESAGT
jgi:glycosyltransferase involved in cell wall biosynthesis